MINNLLFSDQQSKKYLIYTRAITIKCSVFCTSLTTYICVRLIIHQTMGQIISRLLKSQSSKCFKDFTPQRTFVFTPMKMGGMFKCLSVTKGNMALGPEVQFSVKELYTTYNLCLSFKQIGMNKCNLHATKPNQSYYK